MRRLLVSMTFITVMICFSTSCEGPLELYDQIEKTVATAGNEVNTFELRLDTTEGGIVSPDQKVAVNAGVNREISAEPETGYEFVEWEVISGYANIGDTEAPTTHVTLHTSDATVRAVFSRISYTLTIQNNDHCDSDQAPRDYTVDHGIAFDLSVSNTDNEYHFTEWAQIGGDGQATFASPTSAVTTVTVTSGDVTVQPMTEWGVYVYVEKNPVNFVLVTPYIDEQVALNEEVPLSAEQIIDLSPVSESSYEFDQWTIQEGSANISSIYSNETTATVISGNELGRLHFKAHYSWVP